MEEPSDISQRIENLMIYLFYIVGIISLVFNMVTLNIILRHRSALAEEIRFIAVFQQCSCLSSNAFLTLCTIPFFYPKLGAGYCMGLLCAYVPYQVLDIIVVCLDAIMLASFGMMLTARNQLLMMDDSVMKLRPSMRYASYIITNCVLQLMTLMAILALPTSCEDQIDILDEYPQLKWRERRLNYFLFNGSESPTVHNLSFYGFLLFVPIVSTFIILPFTHMIIIVWRSPKSLGTQHCDRGEHIRPAQTLLCQASFLVLFVFVALSFIPSVLSTMADNIYASIQTQIVFAEMVFASFTLVNSMVIISRNRVYLAAMCSLFSFILPRKSVRILNISSKIHLMKLINRIRLYFF